MMYKILPGIITCIAFFLIACGNQTPRSNNSISTTDSSSAPVETKAPNTKYKPAFEGQTRIGGVKTKTAFEGKVLSEALNMPWGITSLPDGRFLITEKEGKMRIATTSGNVSAPITGLP